jgi:hypothetical protein
MSKAEYFCSGASMRKRPGATSPSCHVAAAGGMHPRTVSLIGGSVIANIYCYGFLEQEKIK